MDSCKKEDAFKERQDQPGRDRPVGWMASFRIQRLLLEKNPPPAKDVHGKPGPVHLSAYGSADYG